MQTPDPPILGKPGEKVKLPEMQPLHSQHPLRADTHADKIAFWNIFLKLDAKRKEMEDSGSSVQEIEAWFDTHAGQDIFDAQIEKYLITSINMVKEKVRIILSTNFKSSTNLGLINQLVLIFFNTNLII